MRVTISIYGLIVLGIGVWCQFLAFQKTLVAMAGLSVFASIASLELSAIGGATVTPGDLFILFYVLRLVSMRNGTTLLLQETAPNRPLFAFALLTIWILATAYLSPRVFGDSVYVFTLKRPIEAGVTLPLAPTSGNISQAVYAVGGFVLALATSAFGRKPGGSEAIMSGLVLVTSINIFLAVLDLVTSATHTGFLLDAIHTGNYTFLTADELGGVKRISGAFSEASAFSTFSLMLLSVNFTLYILRVRTRFTGIASLALTALVGLSTSSSGYVGLAAFFVGFIVYAVVMALGAGRKRPILIAAVIVGAGILMVSAVFVLAPSVAKTAQTVLTESVFNKAGSDSALERGSWNQQAWKVFLDTYGFGAGIGATRTSNFVMLLLSNLGVVGFLLYGAFIIHLMFGRLSARLDHEERALIWASRMGVASALFAYMLIGTVYYVGTLFYVLLGFAASGVASGLPLVASAPRAPIAPQRQSAA